MKSQEQPLLRIIHFNDVYDVQPHQKTNQAGAYFFKAHLEKQRTGNTVTLFSGDAFSPSILSTLFDGWQMVHCLNELKIDAACYGNHEFDYEIEHTEELAKGCNFPWLLGNLIDKRTEEPLGSAKDDLILQRNGIRIGLFGIAQEEWLTLLTEDYQGQLDYIDMAKYAYYKANYLRNKQNCDLVIALTHMRVPNDKKLCEQVQEIDFALGGHDHIIHSEVIGKVHLIKSGSNFQNYSVIDLYPKDKKCKYSGHKFNYEVNLHKVTEVPDFDPALKKFVDEKMEVFQKQSQRIVGYTKVPLQTRFAKIRTEETNYGNFVTDLVRAFYNCDVVTINSGGVRIDQLIAPGPIKFSMISNIFDDFLVVKLVPGSILLQMLENSCSKYPAFEGRFLLVSGIRYAFDANLQPWSRVLPGSVYINNKPLDLKREYKVAMHSFTAKGGDGFDVVKDCKYSITAQNAIQMIALLQRFYRTVDQSAGNITQDTVLSLNKRRSSKSDRLSRYADNIVLIGDRYYVEIAPQVEGRVNIVHPFTISE